MNIQETLFAFSTKYGVAGQEDAAAQYAKELLLRYTNNVQIDAMGNVLADIVPKKEGKPYILLDAHIDEIGMIVTHIDENGFVRVGNCGGIDRRPLLAQEVVIHGEEPVYGVVATHPPHLQTEDDRKKTPKMEDILIDIGLSREAGEKCVPLGSRVSIASKCEMLLNGRIKSRALDDRAGVVSILKALDYLKDTELSCSLGVLFSVQEEVGTRGAATGGFYVQPDLGIAVDVSFAYTSDAVEHKCGKMGNGAMIGIAPSLNSSVSRQLIKVAKEQGIPHQLEIMNGTTGTNADSLGISRSGVAMGLLSIPLRYMHTPVEVVQISDIDAVSKLIAEYLKAGDFHV